MPILKVDKRKTEKKLIGAYIPLWLNEYLSLFCLANGYTKSDIIVQLLDVWAAKKSDKVKVRSLVNQVAERLRVEWREARVKDPPTTFDQFKEEVKKELEERGVRPTNIKAILKKLTKEE